MLASERRNPSPQEKRNCGGEGGEKGEGKRVVVVVKMKERGFSRLEMKEKKKNMESLTQTWKALWCLKKKTLTWLAWLKS